MIISLPQELIEKFLNLPPTIDEVRDILFSNKLTYGRLIYRIGSQNKHRMKGYVPDPDKYGWMKWDIEGFKKLIEQDALEQKEMMQRIIDSRTKIPQIVCPLFR